MDSIRQHMLKEQRSNIVMDLDIKNIVDMLLSKNVITYDEEEIIAFKHTSKEKANLLIDYVLKGDNSTYDNFVLCLKEPYRWLWEKLQPNLDNITTDNLRESAEDSLSRGEVPKLPMNYVSRSLLVSELYDKLSKLERHHTLLLYGSPASGKSSLVIGTLRENQKLIWDNFKGEIFWLNVADCDTEDKILVLQKRILNKITQEEKSFHNSQSLLSFASLNSSYYDSDMESYCYKLKTSFEETRLREALIVLDDPNNTKVITAFDVGCKLLILAHDSKLVQEHNLNKMEVPSKFSEGESLELIAKYVEEDVSELPSQAKQMHNRLSGNPLLISMIGALLADNKQRLKHDKKHWKKFLNQFKNKTSFFDRENTNSHIYDPSSAIEMCINSLNDKRHIDIFKSLVIIRDNVKITTRALSTILDMPVNDVESLMRHFMAKSLIIEHYNKEHKTYQYEMHDTIVSYLRSTYKDQKEALNMLHVQLLKMYMKKSTVDGMLQLPNDEYIAYHIGYHIYSTDNAENMWELFHTLYSKLEYVGNKLRLSGPTGFSEDFKYIDKIKNFPNSNFVFPATMHDYIEELNLFIQQHGHDLHRYPCTDIIQSILQHQSKGLLFNEAQSLLRAEHNKDHIYFEFQHQDSEINFSKITVNEQLEVFRVWKQYLFVGTTSGNISVWDIYQYMKLLTYQGHKHPIKAISMNHNTPFKMASTCDSGDLKFWDITNLNLNEDHESDDDDQPDSVSSYYCDVTECCKTVRHVSGKLRDIIWGRKKNLILSHTNPGSTVVFFDTDGNVMKDIDVGAQNEISSSILTQDDRLAIVGLNSPNTHKIYMYCTKSFDLLVTHNETSYIKTLSLIPENLKSILVLTETYLHEYKWRKLHHSTADQAIQNMEHRKIDINRKQNLNYKFQTMTVLEHPYVFIATTDCFIVVYDLKNYEFICVLNNYRGNVISMDAFNTLPNVSVQYLLTASGGDELSIKVWLIDPTQFSSTIIKKMLFDCVFLNDSVPESPIKVAHSRERSEPSVRNGENVNNMNRIQRSETVTPYDKQKQTDKHPKINLRKTFSLDKKNKNCNILNPYIAVADSTNCIQIIKGKELIKKSPEFKIEVTNVAISPTGNLIAYSLKDGDVMIFPSDRIMQITRETITYMEFVNADTLVVAGEEGCLMLYQYSRNNPKDSVAKMLVSSNELGSKEWLDQIEHRKSPEINRNCNGSSMSRSSSSSSEKFRPPPPPRELSRSYKPSSTVKCFLINNEELLTVCYDGSVKLWNFEPKLMNILISKQDLNVECAFLRFKYLAVCDDNGNFQIHKIDKVDCGNSLGATLISKHKITENINCCTISHDNNILAMGCSSGHIVLWHIIDKIHISTIKFHTKIVQSLEFSPMPLNVRTKNDESSVTPLVLVSLAGQVVWWDVSYILNKKRDSMMKYGKNGSRGILSPLPNLPLNRNSVISSESSTSSFEFPVNLCWEKKWKGKRSKSNCNRDDLLSCIKLTGDKALKIKMDEHFSTFVTVDGGGVLCVMNVFDNRNNTNGISTTVNVKRFNL